MPVLRSALRNLWIPAALLLALALLVWFAPEERTLGWGIKVVYVHVAVTWTALLGIAVMGLLGTGVALTEDSRLHSWMVSVGRLTLGVYAASVILGAAASQVNWGGIFWSEPRMLMSFNILAAVLVVQVLNGWLPWRRARGLLAGLLLGFAVWSLGASPLVLHPGDAIRSTSSFGIQFAFFGSFALIVLLALWMLGYLRRKAAADRGA